MTTVLYMISALMGIASVALLIMTYRLNKDTRAFVEGQRLRKLNQTEKEVEEFRSKILRSLSDTTRSTSLLQAIYDVNFSVNYGKELAGAISITGTSTANAPLAASVSIDPNDVRRSKQNLMTLQPANKLAV